MGALNGRKQMGRQEEQKGERGKREKNRAKNSYFVFFFLNSFALTFDIVTAVFNINNDSSITFFYSSFINYYLSYSSIATTNIL